MKVAIYTLGCKVNHYESEAMLELFRAAGWESVAFTEKADCYIVNTCTVTAVSDKKSRQMLARAYRLNPEAVVVAVGCYAQTKPEEVAALQGVSLVIGTDRRLEIVSLVEAFLRNRIPVSAVHPLQLGASFEELSAVADSRTRATLKIQDGCRNFCTYCAIPYARGPLRSRSLLSIRREMEHLAKEGYQEVVLTGIHLNSWGIDSGEGSLTDALLAVKDCGVPRIRLGSLEPKQIDEKFQSVIASMPELCPQFHLSLQSGSDTVLRRMARRYDTADYRKATALLREAAPGCAITTDVIAGFVGETEQEHQQTMAFVEEIRFARIHVFPYSRRRGTAADKMSGHLEKSIKEARAAELISLGDRLETGFVAGMVGREATVLVESDRCGYTENYVRTRVLDSCEEGDLVRVQVTGVEGKLALAHLV